MVPNQFIVACYRCGSSDHFGDFCDTRRGGYVPCTAFNVDSYEIEKLEKLVIRESRSRRDRHKSRDYGRDWKPRYRSRSPQEYNNRKFRH